jgi:predicted nuclease of restriction endonuclease-like (RecB) superfamily
MKDIVLMNKNIKMNKAVSSSFSKFYDKIKEVLKSARNNVYRRVNTEMVVAYWTIGRTIVEEEQKGFDRADYGTLLVETLSIRLTSEFGRGFDKTNLWNMIKFYKTFPILDAVRRELSWTHYRLLIRIEKDDARKFYLQAATEGNWSTRQLERQINSLYYERLLMSSKGGKHLIKKEAEDKKEEMEPGHFIKDPYILEFLNLRSNTNFYESELERALIGKLQDLLLELGNGFSFVSRQYKISTETKHFYVDLVFYNYILKCFLLIDLKTGELTHQDIGQIDLYVRYFEEQIKQEGDNPTIGLILCAEKDRTIVKYSILNDNKQIFASKYKLYLPEEKALIEEMNRERKQIEIEKRLREE